MVEPLRKFTTKGRLRKGEIGIRQYVQDNFPSAREWLYGIRSGRAAESTRSNFAHAIYKYLEFFQINPDQLLEQRRTEFVSQDLKVRFNAEDNFRRFVKDAPYKQSVLFHVSTAVKSFYKFYRMPLIEQGVRGCSQSGEVLDYLPTSEEILKMYLNASERGANTVARDRAYLLLFAQTGLRPRTICSLKFKHVKDEIYDNKTTMAITVPSASTKMKIHGVSFVLEDAKQALVAYLEERKKMGETISGESYLFCSGFVRTQKADPARMEKIVSKLAEMAGLPVRFDGQYRFRSYCLRKRFQTLGEQNKITPNWLDLLMNHIPRGADSSSYSRPSIEMLRTEYSKMAQDLIILPQFVKTLGTSPAKTITYEGLKMAMRFLPLGERTLEVMKRIQTIDTSSQSFQAKYDQVYEIAKAEITRFRSGNQEYEDVIVSKEQAKIEVNEHRAQFVSVFSNDDVVIRKKKVHENEALVHKLAGELQGQNEDGALGLEDSLQIQFNSIQ